MSQIGIVVFFILHTDYKLNIKNQDNFNIINLIK